jgi:hypothetical protein
MQMVVLYEHVFLVWKSNIFTKITTYMTSKYYTIELHVKMNLAILI